MPIAAGPRRLALQASDLRPDIDGDLLALRQQIFVIGMARLMLRLIDLPRAIGFLCFIGMPGFLCHRWISAVLVQSRPLSTILSQRHKSAQSFLSCVSVRVVIFLNGTGTLSKPIRLK